MPAVPVPCQQCTILPAPRWRWQAAAQNCQSGLGLTEPEWEEEWRSVLRLASAAPRPSAPASRRRSRLSSVSTEDELDPLYESLEEVHVLALAHVLRRPIVVVADTVLKDAFGEALAPIPFGGIYLPLEVGSAECDRCPLLLTYDSGHFSALVSMQTSAAAALPTVVPVTDSEHALLPVQFGVDPGPSTDWARSEQSPTMLAQLALQEGESLALLKEYLDLVQVPLPACFLDPSPPLTSPSSQDSGSVRELEVDKPGRTAKQLQSVAKQFGSIGKTVSKKIRKNLGSITRLARTGSFKGPRGGVSQSGRRPSCRIVGGQQDHILAALIHTQKALPCLQEMVDNYLSEARLRFEKDRGLKVLQAEERQRREVRECLTPACRGEGSARTSYLCPPCYQQQLQETRGGAQHGSGRSQFYVAPEQGTYDGLARLPSCRPPSARAAGDRTLYLANSTFYQEAGHVVAVSTGSPVPPPAGPTGGRSTPDGGWREAEGWREEGRPCTTSGCTFYGSSVTQHYCSKCYREQQRVPQASRV